MQGGWIIGELEPAIPDGGNDHLGDPCQRAAAVSRRPPLVAVEVPAGDEDGEPERHDQHWDAEADAPPDVVLDPDDGRGGQQRADVDGEVVPVEEGALGDQFRRVSAVELVRAERRAAGLDAARAERHEVEPHVHRETMDAAGVGRRRRLEQWKRCR